MKLERPARRKLVTFLTALVGIVFFFIAISRKTKDADAPYVPLRDDIVLETLPLGRAAPEARALEEMRRSLEKNPRNLPLAVRVARENIELSRSRSDPRYLGYAEAALSPWYDKTDAPHQVVVLRATIRQSNHDFEGALADLEIALAQNPDDVQAWLTKAVVLTVRAEYPLARVACDNVQRLSPGLATVVCASAIDGMTGKATAAYDTLSAALASMPSANASERAWAETTLGELASRKGDLAQAEAHFRAVLSADPSDAYALAALCDLLLDTKRAGEVIPLLASRESNDGLLLRLVLAARATKTSDAKRLTKTLRARYEASRARGDVVHRREQARFALFVDGNAANAVKLAAANWDVQREIADARILLESANAADDADARAKVTTWMNENHVEDATLHALAGSK